ncbi:hypothetical protein BRADI_4g36120v3 [Brachypodium distachyon]|nr:hypothetical protein BRADI_4g36120v3 [Brachypodium distachyon]
MATGGAGEVRHWTASVNGITLHVAEQGPATGPAVLLLHGFPELWLSWRHQMSALAARGFRALAPDLRGYDDSEVPAGGAAEYTMLHVVGDVVALLDHLGLLDALVAGHDWGAQVLWHLCLFRPDRVRAAVALGVPYFPRSPAPMADFLAARGDGFYISQFQEPGRAEKAFAKHDIATVLKKFYSLELDDLSAPPGVEVIDFFQASSSPLPWMTEEELAGTPTSSERPASRGPSTTTAPWT